MEKIRQPIVTVCGHVDHGKTSILDKIRGTSVAEGEAGGITQKISFTSIMKETIEQRTGEVLKKFKIPLEIPGFLFIDTPGHAAFTNLRKRGGSLADLAVLVVDINEGIKPQTAEVLQILKSNKTPFIIALNKIDHISGWKKSDFAFNSLESQALNVKQEFDEKFYTLVGALNSWNFDAELYFKIDDFTKKIAVVPCSARTREGIAEILAVLVALSQRFLKKRIQVKKQARGVILEIKKEKAVNYLESILYDGELSEKDQIAIANFDKIVVAKIRSIQKSLPLNKGFKACEKVGAASGIRIQLTEKYDIPPGMPFQVFSTEEELEKIKKEFSEEIEQETKTDSNGIVVKADSLGSLEALLLMLRQKQIKVIRAGIGDITKKDIYTANSLPEEDRAILGFNVSVSDDITEEKKPKILLNPVIYKLIEDFEEWKMQKLAESERQKLSELPALVKLTVLDFVFHNSNPAIFGVRVNGGRLQHDIELINRQGGRIGRVKTIQEEKNNIQSAEKGKEVAISLPGVNFERQLEVNEVLYSNLSESQFRKFKENKSLLSEDEKKILMEIAEIKRRESISWGV